MAAINLEYELIYEKPEEEKLFFKNKTSETLIQISKIEFEIIQQYIKTGSISSVRQYFSRDFDLGDDLILELINRAQSINLIIDPLEFDLLKKKKKFRFERLEILIGYIAEKGNPILKKIGVELNLDFKGNFNFYKLLSISFSKSKFADFVGRKSTLFITAYFLMLIWAIGLLIFYWPNKAIITELLNIPPPSGFVVFLTILLGIFITTFFHELGHYIIYSKYGGKTSMMGAALMVGFLPVMYVSTNSLYLWPNKAHRILVAAAGILVDMLLLVLAIDWLLFSSLSTLSFYTIFFAFLFCVRIIANINPFIPGTDGYFILSDFIGIPSLYQSATFNVQKFAQNMRLFRFSVIDRFQLISAGYLMLSILFITSYYLLIGAFILLPFFIKFFL